MHKWEKVYKDKLLSYQREAVDKMLSTDSFLEFDDMGLGKSVISLTVAEAKTIDKAEPKVLIACTSNAVGVWEEELLKWYDEPSIIYSGTPKKRKEQLKHFEQGKYKYMITTYGMLKELPRNWNILICDEIHKQGLLNHKTQLYKVVKEYTKQLDYLYLLTGTPIRQGVIDLYAPLSLIKPKVFRAYWSFVNRYCVTIETPFGKSIERNPRDLIGFREMLNHYMLRRLKSEVEADLPSKMRYPVLLYMTSKQKEIHDSILEDMIYYDKTNDSLTVAPNAMVALLKARQCLVTPRLLGIEENGAILDYFKETVSEYNRPVVIFTPFVDAVDYIAEQFQPDLKFGESSWSIYKLTGTLSPSKFADTWQAFQADKTKRKLMICTIKSGSSFHATTSSDCFFAGYEWDFNLNSQSEDRLCRLGNEEDHVSCNYLLYGEDAADQRVKELVNEKQRSANFILGSDELIKLMTQRREQ